MPATRRNPAKANAVRPPSDDDDNEGAGAGAWKQQLAAALTSERGRGTFACSRVVGGGLNLAPELEVQGVGRLKLPLKGDQCAALLAAGAPAPYGHGTHTVVNSTVRKATQFDSSRVDIAHSWHATLHRIKNQALEALGLSHDLANQVQAHLYKLLLYEVGGHFAPHRDSEKEPGMFATLLVQLPAGHKGGSLEVSHAGQRFVWESMKRSNDTMQYAAFFADCEHQLRPIVSGWRLVLAYNLVHTSPGPLPQPKDRTLQSLTEAVEAWQGCRAAQDRVAVLLDHKYTTKNLDFARLKGRDASLVGLLRACKLLDVHLVLMTKHVVGQGGEDSGPEWDQWEEDEDEEGEEGEEEEEKDDSGCGYRGKDGNTDMLDVLEVKVVAQLWVSPTGRVRPGYGNVRLRDKGPGRPSELLGDTEVFNSDTDVPDEEEDTGYTGNEGRTIEYFYHRTLVVIWPRSRAPQVAAKAGFGTLLNLLEARLQEARGKYGDQGQAVKVEGEEEGSEAGEDSEAESEGGQDGDVPAYREGLEQAELEQKSDSEEALGIAAGDEEEEEEMVAKQEREDDSKGQRRRGGLPGGLTIKEENGNKQQQELQQSGGTAGGGRRSKKVKVEHGPGEPSGSEAGPSRQPQRQALRGVGQHSSVKVEAAGDGASEPQQDPEQGQGVAGVMDVIQAMVTMAERAARNCFPGRVVDTSYRYFMLSFDKTVVGGPPPGAHAARALQLLGDCAGWLTETGGPVQKVVHAAAQIIAALARSEGVCNVLVAGQLALLDGALDSPELDAALVHLVSKHADKQAEQCVELAQLNCLPQRLKHSVTQAVLTAVLDQGKMASLSIPSVRAVARLACPSAQALGPFCSAVLAREDAQVVLKTLLTEPAVGQAVASERAGETLGPATGLVAARARAVQAILAHPVRLSWEMPAAKLPQYPEVQAFLRGPKPSETFAFFANLPEARSFAGSNFGPYSQMRGYSATAVVGGRGTAAFCQVSKTSELQEQKVKEREEQQQELDRLQTMLGMPLAQLLSHAPAVKAGAGPSSASQRKTRRDR